MNRLTKGKSIDISATKDIKEIISPKKSRTPSIPNFPSKQFDQVNFGNEKSVGKFNNIVRADQDLSPNATSPTSQKYG